MLHKFQLGDIVYLMSSSVVARTITNINHVNREATVTWVPQDSSVFMSHTLPLAALYLAPSNPRTLLKVGDIVSYTKTDGSIIYMPVHSFEKTINDNPSPTALITCQRFEKDELVIQEFCYCQLSKVQHRFESLNVTIKDSDGNVEYKYLGTYMDYPTFQDLFDPSDVSLNTITTLYNELEKNTSTAYKKEKYEYTFLKSSLNTSL